MSDRSPSLGAATPTIVEVLGVSPRNKGAMLMLEAIREQIKNRWPDAQIAVPATMPIAVRTALGLRATPKRDMRRIDIAPIARFFPFPWRRRGYVLPHEVNVILDASGFGYGDYWGVRKLSWRLLRAARGPGPANRVIVLLPQALGPFTKPGIAAAFCAAAKKVDLVFARDAVSLTHLHAIGLNEPKIRRAPDFTNLLHPVLPARLEQWRGWSFVIPNEKMVIGLSDSGREAYVRFVAQAVEALTASGRRVALLIHEGAADRRLAEEANTLITTPVPILDEASPLVTKALVGAADLIVSSRFHGLVSALSAGVPALACGWSHKYRELLADYGTAEHIIDINDHGSWNPRLAAFLADAERPEFRARLTTNAERERVRSEAMWDAVFAAIDDQRL